MFADPFALNMRHLRAIVAIVEHGGMGAAARSVNLSQPALTQGLAKLERQLGTGLFDRRPEGLCANTAGLLLVERTRAALGHLAAAARGLRANGRGFARPDMLMSATQMRALRDLEQLSGATLASRVGRMLVVTAAGRRLARGIRLAAGEIAAAIGELSPNADAATPIRIGAMPLSRALLLPTAIAAFIREGPRAPLMVREGSWRELVEPLRDGAIDMMVGALRDPPPLGLVQRPLFADRLIIVGRAGHPLAGQDASSDDLRRFGWIVGQYGTPLRARWIEIFANGTLPDAPLECGSAMVIRGVLRDTDLLTLLSRDQVAMEIDHAVLARIGPSRPHGPRMIGITTRENWRATTTQQRFIDLLAAAPAETAIQENDRASFPIGGDAPPHLTRDRMADPAFLFLGYGEAAQAFHDLPVDSFGAYDRKTQHAVTRTAKLVDYARNGAIGFDSNGAGVGRVALILSLVTADQALAAARESAAAIAPGALYCDLNSVAPDTKRGSASHRSGGRALCRCRGDGPRPPVLPPRTLADKRSTCGGGRGGVAWIGV